MPSIDHVIRGVRKADSRLFALHQQGVVVGRQGVSADESMIAEEEDITPARHRRFGSVWLFDRLVVVVVAIVRRKLADDDVDLWDLETRERHVEVDGVQLAELDRQHLLVPAGFCRELVVGDDVGALLVLTQMLERDRRHFRHAEQLRRGKASVPSDHVALAIDQDRVGKAEPFDAVGDLLDLFLRMGTRVVPVRCERVGWSEDGWQRS